MKSWFTYAIDPDGIAVVREHRSADEMHRVFCEMRALGDGHGRRIGWTRRGCTRADVAAHLGRSGYAVTWGAGR